MVTTQLQTGPGLAHPAAADFHTIEVDPDAAQAAALEPNRLVLKVGRGCRLLLGWQLPGCYHAFVVGCYLASCPLTRKPQKTKPQAPENKASALYSKSFACHHHHHPTTGSGYRSSACGVVNTGPIRGALTSGQRGVCACAWMDGWVNSLNGCVQLGFALVWW